MPRKVKKAAVGNVFGSPQGGVCHVRVMDFKEIETVTPFYRWELNPKIKYTTWIQKLCFWILEKLGCRGNANSMAYTYHQFAIDTDKIMDSIFAGLDSKRTDVFGEHGNAASRIYIGRKNLEKFIMGTDADLQYFKSTIGSMETMKGRYKISGRMVDIPIVVIPWMEGILVV